MTEEDIVVALADLNPQQLADEYRARLGYGEARASLRGIPDARVERAVLARRAEIEPLLRWAT